MFRCSSFLGRRQGDENLEPNGSRRDVDHSILDHRSAASVRPGSLPWVPPPPFVSPKHSHRKVSIVLYSHLPSRFVPSSSNLQTAISFGQRGSNLPNPLLLLPSLPSRNVSRPERESFLWFSFLLHPLLPFFFHFPNPRYLVLHVSFQRSLRLPDPFDSGSSSTSLLLLLLFASTSSLVLRRRIRP